MIKLIKLRNILIYIDIILIVIATVLFCRHIINIENDNKEIKNKIKELETNLKINYDDIINKIENK